MNTRIRKFNFSKAIIPNTFTAFNAISGFFAIVFASEGNIKTAAVFIIVAGIFDALDGIVARIVGTSSRFGVELDSLSDIISFGTAPAFLFYMSYFKQFDLIGIALSSLLLIFGAFRLARFNVQIEDLTVKQDFRGLPIPVSAITSALFCYSFYRNGTIREPYAIFAIPLVLLLSFLMISNIKYNKLPAHYGKTLVERIIIFILIIIAMILVFITDGVALFYIFLSVVLFGIFRQLIFAVLKKDDDEKVNINKEIN